MFRVVVLNCATIFGAREVLVVSLLRHERLSGILKYFSNRVSSHVRLDLGHAVLVHKLLSQVPFVASHAELRQLASIFSKSGIIALSLQT